MTGGDRTSRLEDGKKSELGGQPGRALDGNTSGQWNDGFVELLTVSNLNVTKIHIEP